MLKYSLTQQHKAQEHKQQVTSYELVFLGILCDFLRCVINDFSISHNAFPIVVGSRGEKCKKSEKLHFIFLGACDSPGVLAPNTKRML